MNTPTWKLIVGGLAIYFGLWGTVSSVLSIAGTLSLSTQIKTEVMGEPNNGGISNHEPVEDPIRLFSEKPNWAIAMVMITLVVSVIYMVGGLALIKKPLGDRVFYLAIALSVLWGVAKTILFTQGHPQMLMAVLPTFAPSFIIDFVLAGIVFVKMRFPKNEEALTHQQEQSRQTYSSESPPSKVKIPMITGWFAVLCVAVFPFWIMGIPGVDNNYARGWKMGLQVLWVFPVTWLVVYGIHRFLKNQIHASHHKTIETGTSVCLCLFFGIAILRLGQALSLISG